MIHFKGKPLKFLLPIIPKEEVALGQTINRFGPWCEWPLSICHYGWLDDSQLALAVQSTLIMHPSSTDWKLDLLHFVYLWLFYKMYFSSFDSDVPYFHFIITQCHLLWPLNCTTHLQCYSMKILRKRSLLLGFFFHLLLRYSDPSKGARVRGMMS